jgi:hypothetical protein
MVPTFGVVPAVGRALPWTSSQAHPSPVPWQFHELSRRGRVVVSQMPQAVTTFLLFLVLAVVQAPGWPTPWCGGPAD